MRWWAPLAFWQVAIVALLLLTRIHPLADFGLKFYIDIFAVGRSDFKVISFLLFVFILLTFRYFRAARMPIWLPVFNLLLVVLLFSLGVAEYVSFSSQYFPAPYESYAQYRDTISSTAFYHIHNSKAILAYLQQLAGSAHSDNYDSGTPYLFFHSRHLLTAHTALYVIFLLSSLYQLAAYKRLPLGMYALFALVSFMMMKITADGGPFFTEGFAGFPIYAAMQCMLWQKKRREDWEARAGFLYLLGLLSLLLFAWGHTYHHDWLNERLPLRHVVLLEFLFVAACAFNLIEQKQYRAALCGIVLLLGLYTAAGVTRFYYSYGVQQMAGITQMVRGKFIAFVANEKMDYIKSLPQSKWRILKVNTIGNFSLLELEALQPFRLYELQSDWKIRLMDDTIKVDDSSCSFKLPYEMKGYIYVLDTERQMQPILRSYNGVHIALYPASHQEKSKPFLSEYKLYMPGCTPGGIAILRSILNDNGIIRSVITLGYEHQ